MTEIIVLSDTHGNRKAFEYLKEIFERCDLIIHLGDTSSDGRELQCDYPNKARILNGNCDVYPFGSDELVLPVEDIKIFACHGHKYSVKSGRARLAARAKQEGCRIALYGHTHTAKSEEFDGVTALNPGALHRYGEKSFLRLLVNKEKVTSEIIEIGKL